MINIFERYSAARILSLKPTESESMVAHFIGSQFYPLISCLIFESFDNPTPPPPTKLPKNIGHYNRKSPVDASLIDVQNPKRTTNC